MAMGTGVGVTEYQQIGGFNPESLSGLVALFMQEASIVGANGVEETRPTIGVDGHFDQTDINKQPDIATGSEITGIQGDNVDDLLRWGNTDQYFIFASGTPATFGITVEIPAWDSNGFWVRTGNNGYGIYVNSAGSMFTSTTTNVGTICSGTLSLSLNTKYRFIVIRDSSGNVRGYVNGSDVTVGTPTAGGLYQVQGLNGRYNSGFRVNADIVARGFAYNSDHTSELSNLDDWLDKAA